MGFFALLSVRVLARREDFLAQCGSQRVAQTAESAVSPVANRRVRANGWGVKAQPTPLFHHTPAGWQPAIPACAEASAGRRQVGNLRYFGCGSAALRSLRSLAANKILAACEQFGREYYYKERIIWDDRFIHPIGESGNHHPFIYLVLCTAIRPSPSFSREF